MLLTIPALGDDVDWKTVRVSDAQIDSLVVVPIDQDLTCPPVADFSPLPGVRGYTPRRVRNVTYAVVTGLLAEPQRVDAVTAPLLTKQEMTAVRERLRLARERVDATVRTRGAAAVFFAEPAA